MFESLKKKFSGTIGKISDQLSSEEEEAAGEKTKTASTEDKTKKTETVSSGKTQDKKVKTDSGKDQEDKDKSDKTPGKDESVDFKEEADEEKKSRFSFFRRKSDSEDEDSKKQDKDDTGSKLKTEDSSVKVKAGTDSTTDSVNDATDSVKSTDSGKDKGESGKDTEEGPSGLFTFATHKTISEKDIDDILFELELALLEGDVALEVAEQIVKSVKEDLVGRKIKRRSDVAEFTREALKKAISDILVVGGPNLKELVQQAKKTGEPLKIMFVGVNGTGKTTTISKIADHYVKEGYTPVIAASDTFRAGAIEQISYHAEKVGVKIIRHQKGADPAAVAYDAVEHARAKKKELVLIDTAGRMQTNVNLMDEMKKIQRVVKPDLAIFVGDALTGNDAVEQARKFDDAVGVDGIILTKADADAKGGAALSIGHVINKPILFLGVGQGYGDIMEFHPDWMVEQVLGD
ncbi:signal recognition particle-docking protein FtsY [Methanobacterium sp.]|uniref:signal recognition particle-docking protein FtsY n=1 Tax=Methanobacterium sp. TaxID=2164 RepID=UPI002ABA78CC|nr:signal recognition particle-docking protein FtsY [Methanobacterium sp.]MDY9922492.1 signal recognition particle-docking protein FtsY [Methanobacterium sp.]